MLYINMSTHLRSFANLGGDATTKPANDGNETGTGVTREVELVRKRTSEEFASCLGARAKTGQLPGTHAAVFLLVTLHNSFVLISDCDIPMNSFHNPLVFALLFGYT
jgi:hypothetical protein